MTFGRADRYAVFWTCCFGNPKASSKPSLIITDKPLTFRASSQRNCNVSLVLFTTSHRADITLLKL